MVTRISASMRKAQAEAELAAFALPENGQGTGLNNQPDWMSINKGIPFGNSGSDIGSIVTQGLSSLTSGEDGGFLKKIAELLVSNAGGRAELNKKTKTDSTEELKNSAKAQRYRQKLLTDEAKYTAKLLKMGFPLSEVEKFLEEEKAKAGQISEKTQEDVAKVEQNNTKMQTSRENIDNYQSELASLDPRNEFVNGQTMTLSGNNQDGSSGLYQWNPAGQINGQGSDNSNPSFLNNPDQQRYVELQQAIVQEQDNCAVLSENNKVTVVEMTQNAKELDDINNNIVTQTDQVATLQTEVTDTGSDVTTDFSQTTSDAGTGAGDSTLNVADAGVNTVKAGVNTVTGGEQQAAAIAASMNMATVSAAPKLESESVANLENGATNAVENGSTVAKGINDALAFTTTAISSVGSLINYSSQIGSMLGTTEQTASDAEEVGSSVNETKSTIDATIVGVGSDNPDLLV